MNNSLTRKKLIKEYLDFFNKKNHQIIPSSSLIPSNDPTVLFTTAGMHPLVPYLIGQEHPLGKRLASVQKCIRTGDIDSVGDETHHTFFEMLGNWSLGDYWKKESIEFSLEFLTNKLKIKKEELNVTCFKGYKEISKDTESEKIWKSLGIEKIKFLGKEDNWWGPAGKTGPCGPDTEIFIGDVEIWNNVFMQYNKNDKEEYENLKQKNVDTGMGVERVIAILSNEKDSYLTDCWKPIIKKIEVLSGRSYKDNKKTMRIIADHIKASIFILCEKITPGTTEQSYVLRRLLRRAIRYGKLIELENFTDKLVEPVLEIYSETYPELKENLEFIKTNLIDEEEKFSKVLEKGLKKFKDFSKDKKISGIEAFKLYQSYGFPLEMIKEESEKNKIQFNERDFKKEEEKHKKLSKTASEGRFKSGLSDNGEMTTRLHTATHLLNEALRKVLGEEIKQKGSNITPERLRFDFNFDRKLTQEEKTNIEKLVNEKIKENLKIKSENMELKKAIDSGAQSEFGTKYPEIVSVYTIEDPKDKRKWFSKEICTGPHVKETSELGEFKIIKEESSSAGVRRIKAKLN